MRTKVDSKAMRQLPYWSMSKHATRFYMTESKYLHAVSAAFRNSCYVEGEVIDTTTYRVAKTSMITFCSRDSQPRTASGDPEAARHYFDTLLDLRFYFPTIPTGLDSSALPCTGSASGQRSPAVQGRGIHYPTWSTPSPHSLTEKLGL